HATISPADPHGTRGGTAEVGPLQCHRGGAGSRLQQPEPLQQRFSPDFRLLSGSVSIADGSATGGPAEGVTVHWGNTQSGRSARLHQWRMSCMSARLKFSTWPSICAATARLPFMRGATNPHRLGALPGV